MKRTVTAEIVHRKTNEKATARITVETEGDIDFVGDQLFDKAKGDLMSTLNPTYRNKDNPTSNLHIRLLTDDGLDAPEVTG